MALLDIFKGKKKKADEKLKRPPKGVFKQSSPANTKDTGGESDFDRKEGEEGKKAKQKPKESILASRVILSPHTTEKSAVSAENGVYVFRVAPNSNKVMIKRAIEELYGFKPRKVSIISVPSKKRINRGKVGTKPGFKKSVVYLKEGDKIDLT